MEEKNRNQNGTIESFIKKPILSIVFSLFVLLLGSFALFRLQIRNMPKVEKGIFVIDVHTVNPMDAREVEDHITQKISKLLPSVPNLDYFHSTSKSSNSQVYVYFKPGISEANALNDLRSVLSRLYLGSHTKAPIIYSRSDDEAMLRITFYPKNRENNNIYFDNLNSFIENVFIPEIKKIDGVGSVENYGHSKPQFYIELNFLKMAQMGIRPQEISNAINKEATISTYGDIKTGVKSFSCTSRNNIVDMESLGNILVDQRRGIRIKDISNITIRYPDNTRIRLFNGKIKTIGVEIYKTGEGNPLAISKAVNNLLKDKVNHDTEYIVRNSFENSEVIFEKTKRTFLEAIILLFLILILFLGAIRILLLPLVAIPLSIAGTYIFMWYFNLSINEMTLMAFLLTLGLLVDDAILIIENIERKRKERKRLDDNIVLEATLEIYKSVIVMTATLFCVFLPVVFLPGEIGYTLREFALTISTSVGWSCVFSLLLTPMMCKYFMQNYEPYLWTEKFLHWLENSYRKLLEIVFRYKKKLLVFLTLFNFSGLSLIFLLKTEYYPKSTSEYFTIYTNGLKNMKVEYLEKTESEKIRNIVEKYGKYMEYFYITVTNGEVEVNGRFLKGLKKLYLGELQESLKEKLPYISFFSYGSGNDNLCFSLVFSSYEESAATENAYKFMDILDKTCLIQEYTFIQNSRPGYVLEIDEERCASKKISPEDVRQYVDFLFQSHKMHGKIRGSDNKKYKIILQQKNIGLNRETLKSIIWKTTNKYGNPQVVTLHDLIKIQPINTEVNMETYNGLPSKYVRVVCKKNITAGDIDKAIQREKKKYLPKEIYLHYGDELQEYVQNSGQVLYIFLACLLSIFLILSVQFNSFINALIVMLTVPLAFAGSVVVLYFFGTVNIFSAIGAITLVALITKHGILFMSKSGNVIDIAVERLRPLLMTTVAMILGNLPLLFYREIAMLPLKQMAIVIVPGLFYGTIMILIFFPLILSFKRESV